MKSTVFPFVAVVGQEAIKKSLIWNIVNPCIGGVLIRGKKGAAKSIAALGVDGHRADIAMIKTAMTIAAYNMRETVSKEDLKEAASYVLPHRMRRRPFEGSQIDMDTVESKINKIIN